MVIDISNTAYIIDNDASIEYLLLRGTRYIITKDTTYLFDNISVTVPIGFTTDFITAWVFKCFFNDYGIMMGTILHDYLYHTNIVPIKKADMLLYEVLKYYKVSMWKRIVIKLVLSTGIGKLFY